MTFKKSLKIVVLVLLLAIPTFVTGNVGSQGQAQEEGGMYCLDDYTLRVRLEEPDATFLAWLVNGFVVGVGPYKLVEVSDDRIVYEANEEYWGEAPKTPKVIEVFYTNSAALRAAVEAGEVDVVDVGYPFYPEDILDLLQNPNLRVIKGPSPFIRYLVFTVTKPPFDNVHVRRAISYAVDRDTLNTIIFGSLNAPLYSMVPPGLWSHIDAFPKRDLGKAKAELEKAGYSESNPLQITLWYRLNYTEEAVVAAVLKHSLEETGVIQVDVRGHPDWIYVKLMREGALGFFLDDWYPDFIDPNNFLAPWLTESPKSLGTWLDEATSDYDKEVYQKFVELLEGAKATIDKDKRTALYEEAQRVLADSAVLIPLWQNNSYAVAQKNVRGIVLDASGSFRDWLIYKDNGDPLVIGTTERTNRITKRGAYWTYWDLHVLQQISNGLVTLNPYETIPSPSLAQSWEVSADGTVYTFHLRRGITFSDGTPLTCPTVSILASEASCEEDPKTGECEHHGAICWERWGLKGKCTTLRLVIMTICVCMIRP